MSRRERRARRREWKQRVRTRGIYPMVEPAAMRAAHVEAMNLTVRRHTDRLYELVLARPVPQVLGELVLVRPGHSVRV